MNSLFKEKNIIMKLVSALLSGVLFSLFVSCANMGAGPQGGPKDMMPPSYVKSQPARSQVKVRPERVEIVFDEYVEMKDGQNVVVSPPFDVQPDIKAVGKKVIVDFKDTLKSNTTYVIDFANSIVDYREGNPLRNYYFEFSTGNEIDSFTIAGNVVDAQTLVPMEGVLVGAYTEWTDTTFTGKVLEHVAKTDANGRFLLRGLKERPYRIVALEDGNSNFKYDCPGEYYGLLDTVVTPHKRMVERCDTTFRQVNRDSLLGKDNIDTTVDTLVIDTVKCRMSPCYYPDSLELVVSQRYMPVQEFVKGERKSDYLFTLYFNNSEPKLPSLKLLEQNSDSVWYVLEASVTTDTLTYYLTDSMLVNNDTLSLEMTYDAIMDSTEEMKPQTDTLTLVYKRPKKSKKEADVPKLKVDMSGAVEIAKKPVVKFDKPVSDFEPSMLLVYAKDDTTRKSIPFTVSAKEGKKEFIMDGNWESGKSYVVKADSGVIHNIYGHPNDSLNLRFRMKTVDEYSNFKLTLENRPSGTLFMELIQNDKVEYRAKLDAGQTVVVFKNLKPGTYAVSLWKDENANDKWDSGDFKLGHKPEEVWFYHKAMTMNAGWDYDEVWSVGDRPKYKQRPSSTYTSKRKK